MKKLLIAGIVLSSSLFATSLEDRVTALEKRVAKLEQKLNMVDKTQKTIKKDITNSTVLKCNKVKIVKYDYKYENNGLTQSYNFTYTIKNTYNKPIKYLYASISFIDNNHVKMVEDYIKRSITIEPNQTVTVKTNYLIDEGSLGETLKDTPKQDVHVKFKPFEIDFADGQVLECR